MSALVTDDMVEAAAIALRNQTRERVGLSPLDRLPWSPASGEARADARADRIERGESRARADEIATRDV